MSNYYSYENTTFTDIYHSQDEFLTAYKESGFPILMKDDDVKLTFWLLYSKYGNSQMVNADRGMFEASIFRVMFQYGPNWAKELEIQERLRNLTEDEIKIGARQIYNNAINPGTAPDTASLETLDYINSQNTANHKKSILGAYMELDAVLKRDVTEAYLNNFKKLFKTFVNKWYQYKGDDDEC